MTITPLKRNVICRKAEQPKSSGGVLLPDALSQYRNHYEVIAVGTECVDLVGGEKVLLPDAGGAIDLPGGLVHIAEDKVLAVL